MTMAETRQQSNRRIRQEALREQLAEQCRVQHIIEDLRKIDELAAIKFADFENADEYIASVSSAKDKASIIKIAMDGRLKLLNKYLPDLKSVEVVDEDGNDALPRSITINVVANKYP